MKRDELVELIRRKQSFLCVGLDTDPNKIPEHLKSKDDGVLQFNKAIIEATLPYAVSYKLNIAFYEAMGEKGWDILRKTIDLIPRNEALIIADAKRGDIGNTADRYAHAFFNEFNCHAVTINPYMGEDSITPFVRHENHWAIVLGLTSNKGAKDFELLTLKDGRYVYEAVIQRSVELDVNNNIMFVVGATQSEHFERIRAVAPNHFLLVPGVGAQGGTLADLNPLITDEVGLLVNSSRKIIYASSDPDYAEAAKKEAHALQEVMSKMIS